MKPKFLEVFKCKESQVEWITFTFAPGRVNFYGEHTDYMGGYVCPGGLYDGCHILVGRVSAYKDSKIRFGTTDGRYFELSSLESNKQGKDWTVFARGAATITFEDLGKTLDDPAYKGICVLSHSSIPIGSGMSASAAYDVTLMYALQYISKQTYKQFPKKSSQYPVLPKGSREDKIKITKQAQLIENKFCGVNVGIMDQFSCVHATAGCFMALDCNTLTYKNHVIDNLTGPDNCFLLIDSMVKHELTGTNNSNGYNAIRSDIEGAEHGISKVKMGGKPFRFCDFARDPKKYTDGDYVQFVTDCKSAMTPSQYARGVFNLLEQIRTYEFIALTDPNCPLSYEEKFKKAGDMLNATHNGQRDVLGISTDELNLIQETVNKDKDVAGGRIMGGGFGGCVLLLLRKSAVDRVVGDVRKAFQQKFNLSPPAYPVILCDGAVTVSLWNGEKSSL
ncbi:Galactokinase galactose-binding signature/GHMP kinases N terminal domain/GHMP kinases C terminal, putative [Angomonas deanei]|uniref:Galactokinase galactose-binding signature/GHMP kinases N terminal domain/GHMP kinases C terminal, putative n=1 Tax=Angomonas deanei TaxID=59799 RepID=A0A7G2CMF2_9TRYP|nr:Galactokinase galactose-binding signature/GHMP kinases N terminal domain/GHMP kinases C terminal, putative [Angomonas deanei]